MKKELDTVRVIISDLEDRILLLKRNTEIANGLWNLPGGKVEFNDSLEKTAIKEVLEETNLELLSVESLFQYNVIKSYDPPNTIVNCYYFKSNFYRGEFKINSESSEYKWISEEELNYYHICCGNDEAIEKYFLMN